MTEIEEIEQQKQYIKKVKELNKNRDLKYSILTMGCQLNENDSEKICGMLEQMGYKPTDNIQEANLAVFNTCCVRENAEERLFGKIGELKNLKEKNNLIIAIGGCMMQEKHIIEKLKKSFHYIDIIFGTHTLHKLPEDIFTVLEEQRKVKDILDIDGNVYEDLPIKRNSKTTGSVTIMYGCNNFCTYCIVPYVRGRERSRKPKDIINEVKDLAKQGYKEIMLLGQNVNSYLRSEIEEIKQGKLVDENGDYKEIDSFAKLLRAVNEIEGIERIRFQSPHPKDFTLDVIEAIRDCDKICKLIHLPLQSGSTEMLKKMNRKYTKEQYLDLVDKMKSMIPGVKFSTDIIVGFAGETESDFEDTLDVVRKVNYEQVFMFIYSIRVGTPGEKMPNQVPEDIKHKRFDRLKELVESQIAKTSQEYVGTIQKVLVEGPSKNNDKMLTGRTETNRVVVFEGDSNLINQIIEVKITEDHLWYFVGKEV
ncbi:MAG TPA: tRNA (N6-isopentenyl adenosine(37)-C2)-methylthiotransferase MiaB [Clostridiales bacterium]|nr:tRNA (N6-isopentenyl adenosine(37)-C2)-methylthiotransferase MiaB [Clostridiales bacterium]